MLWSCWSSPHPGGPPGPPPTLTWQEDHVRGIMLSWYHVMDGRRRSAFWLTKSANVLKFHFRGNFALDLDHPDQNPGFVLRPSGWLHANVSCFLSRTNSATRHCIQLLGRVMRNVFRCCWSEVCFPCIAFVIIDSQKRELDVWCIGATSMVHWSDIHGWGGEQTKGLARP